MTDKRPTLTLKPKARPARTTAEKTARPAAKPGQGASEAGSQKPVYRPSPERAAAAPRREHAPLRQSHEVKVAPQRDYRPDLKSDSLALSLLGAANAVARVRAGSALPQALSAVFSAYEATPQARGAIQDIAYRSMRQLGRSETLLGLMTSKAPEPPMLGGLLCAALALLDPPEGSAAPYEAFTVVDQAVNAAASHPDFAHAKAMVNAVLRRFLREREALVAEAVRQPLARWNYPQWWIDSTRAAYPEAWESILAAGNVHPPLTLRVNRRRTDVETYLKTLQEAGFAAEQVGPGAVRLAQAVNVSQIPGFHEGVVSVQDAGAQLAAPLLDLADGMRVLDACAAPGGKSGHILETADVDLTSVDADPQRLARVGDNLGRLGLEAKLVAAEAQETGWWDGRPFDRILADVPCTASGIVRRHPDIRWLRRKSDTLQLATLSTKILDNLWQMLLPNGKLLFVTCSLWPQESEAQAAAFAARHDAIRLDAPGQLLPASGAGQDHDGLFYALFQKKAA
ncbi:16S rRNA (cytosine(967)-C(5))-methyltransferase RsmB [Massilia sp. IC2-477]|uniref:16S rRNA (cytosine(967)-C(5))-methyltransferase RsmB n=1 Tax=unclassified Massilia TaxID=2609279 RepID=UPI001D10E662|nr:MULTISPECIES: 16S rRNA (cytosine(967)-C(5))-methyltransferase RsmB [unclassified Massilia]MCC2958150.1 16S rRNA (cytosine(967)-C(5))-methyltransferase RsmB [Massilia sp. IC2-477]MCC2971306.1 16S rRNA (cytosine(967)-C(5))-methyltransferase RsmB [Massilia sp. IC2-476]